MMIPAPKKPIGEVTLTVEIYSDYELDLDEVRAAIAAELDNMDLDIDCDDAPDGVAVAGLSAS